MKNSEILTHLTALQDLKGLKLGGKISLVLAKNKKKLTDAYEILEDVRIGMCVSVAEKNEDGTPKMETKNGVQAYVFLPDVNKKLGEDYTEVLEQQSGVEIEKFNVGLIDQFSDITPQQAESLLMFTE